MEDLMTMITRLRRPRLLVRAAHYGAARYERAKHMPQGAAVVGRSTADIVMQLLMLEAEINQERLQGSGNYVARNHLELLTAVIAEGRALAEARAQPNASGSDAFFCAT